MMLLGSLKGFAVVASDGKLGDVSDLLSGTLPTRISTTGIPWHRSGQG